jgi:hypothetical protein
MIQELKTYACDGIPTDEDIQQAIDIAQRDGCLIKLSWYVKHSGNYSAIIAHDSTLESVRAQMPRVYGI